MLNKQDLVAELETAIGSVDPSVDGTVVVVAVVVAVVMALVETAVTHRIHCRTQV